MNTVQIAKLIVLDANNSSTPFQFTVRQGGKSIKNFRVNCFPDATAAHDAARDFAAQLEATPWVSPFITHRDVIMAGYGTAKKLRGLVLSLFNRTNPFDVGSFASFDAKHWAIALELIESYRVFGENDEEFMTLAGEIRNEQNAAR